MSKSYPVAIKEPGFAGSLRHLLFRNYRSVEAVKEVSFSIEAGEMVGFLGPNGAGKTTTLKMLTGLLHPSSGSVSVAGHVPYRRSAPFLRKIALATGQKQQLIWDLPALETLRINAAVYDIPEPEFRRRIDEFVERLSLEDKLMQPVRKLSLGERMKAELVAALLHRPQVLFLDEPTLGLDINTQVAIRDFLREYNRRLGATVLLTSHYMADVTALCQRVLLIHEGRLTFDGSLASLRERFTDYKEIEVKLGFSLPPEELATYAELKAVEGQSVRFMVQADALTHTVTRILSELEVVDLNVSDPPVEEAMVRAFRAGVGR